MLVGISGVKRSGKDSTCQFLVEILSQRGFPVVRRALADALKEEVAYVMAGQFSYLDFSQKAELYKEILSEMHSDELKENHRLLLQAWGTDFKRRVFGSDYWRKRLLDWYTAEVKEEPNLIAIVPDIRFPDEADMIKTQGGVLIKVKRPGFEGKDTHPSETALNNYSGWDIVISASTLKGLKFKVESKVDFILERMS